MKEPTVNIPQAMQLTGLSRRSIYYAIAEGRIPAIKTRQGLRVYRESLPRRQRRAKSFCAIRTAIS